ncbi:unnamed protein product [Plutella xylostella]|uniref:(diamondback moth) hypothetical protein n=1 Tax=Plutella xylostella TaxID=51655 RepID=A0A8S4FLV4_PLUXY|nr:unnamed protein product [Plutella xylostella]
MEAPSIDTVYQAISALYETNPNAKNDKEKASTWLGDVQKSIHSWKIADELLQQKKSEQSYYFAAQTMRSKVQHNLAELPAESLLSLRDSLVAHLKETSGDTSPAVLTQLCLALADLALQMPVWQNSISDFISNFSNGNAFVLLEILTVLPQEIDSSNLKLGENRREDIKAELRSNSQIVTMFLKESIMAHMQNTHIALKIVKCMTSWIQVRAINIQDVPQNAVIGYSLQVLREHDSINTLHDAASDCICSLLHCLEENNNDDSVERLLFNSVSELESSYHMAVANEEEEKAANYARVFTELAESFLEKIILSASSGESHFAVRSLELALVCVGHHDYEVAEITFNLWYRLSEEVYQRDYQPLTDTFKPHIERLIAALARHCQCEPDRADLPDEGDDFYEFRTKVTELIKDVVFIVGSSCVFRQMFAALQASAAGDPAPWEQTEAALFVMQAVANNILPDENEYVPKVVEAILSAHACKHPAVRRTCMSLLGELCEWVERHGECLPACLQCLLRAVAEPATSLQAAAAVHNICKASRASCGAHVPALLEATRAADQLQLPPPAACHLVRALGAALGALPPPQLTVALQEACAVQLSPLSALAARPPASIERHSVTDPGRYLDRLAALFRALEPPPGAAAAAAPALLQAWPVLNELMHTYQSNGRVMERLCRALRFGLRCVGARAAPLLPALAARMATLYHQHTHSCLLYLASILVDELSSEAACVAPLLSLLEALMPRAFTLLQDGGLRDHPDTVDDLFRLCIRFLQRIPLEFLSSGAMDAVVGCASLAAALDHREANSSVMKFLYDLTRAANLSTNDPMKTRVKELADNHIKNYGESLTYALLEASVLHLHGYMLGEVAEVLVELAAWQRARGADWLRPALARLPRDRAAAATEQQCWQFHQYAMRVEKVKEMSRMLRDFARLYQ